MHYRELSPSTADQCRLEVSHQSDTGHRGRGKAEKGLRHTGLIQADFDDVVGEAAQRLVERLRADPHTRLIFRSPRGGKGKAFFKVSTPTTAHEHKAAFQAVVQHCRAEGYGEIDTIVAPVNSLCFISHDPDATLKDATALAWEATAETPLPVTAPTDTPEFQFDGEIPDWLSKALAHLDADDYHVWLAVGSALKHGGIPFEAWDLWSQTSDKYNR